MAGKLYALCGLRAIADPAGHPSLVDALGGQADFCANLCKLPEPEPPAP